MKSLTSRQQAILEYLQSHFFENGYWPSIRDIQRNFEFRSTNAVMGHLRALENKEYITRVPGQARAFRLNSSIPLLHRSSSNVEAITIPIYGYIAAGYPESQESNSSVGNLHIDVSTANISNLKDTFALKIKEESMSDIGIFEGDVVILELGEPSHNDIVAVLIDGKTTLHRFIQPTSNDTPYLKAESIENPTLRPAEPEFEIQGIARSLVRTLNNNI